jgi:hypothetical protein
MYSTRRCTVYSLIGCSLTCLICLFTACSTSAALPVRPPLPTVSPSANSLVSVLTYHNDNARTGQNRGEMLLTTTNVNKAQFGKLFSRPVNGLIRAQPLYVPHVTIQGTLHNVVYVVTTADQVYAFDADNAALTNPLWQANLVPRGATDGKQGILGTPVIATSNGRGIIYLVSFTKENNSNVQRLHALDIATGQELAGSPLLIKAPGFDSSTIHERTGMLLLNGIVYGGWASFAEQKGLGHGWVIGFDATTLQQVSAWNTTPNGVLGSIWQSVAGLSSDIDGNIYPITGNGTFDANTGGSDYGDSFIKLSTSGGKLTVTDYFSPFNQSCLSQNDLDLGSAGNLILPEQKNTAHPHLMLSGGKEGRLYLIDRDHMGRFTPDPNLQCGTNEEKRTDIDRIVQESSPGFISGLYMAPAYWSGPNGQQFIYISASNDGASTDDAVKAFQLSNDRLDLTPTSMSRQKFNFPGAGLAISSNGSIAGTGVLWALQPGRCSGPGCNPSSPGILHAYDATNLDVELYNSQQNSTRDAMDSYMKFAVPIVANGKVYVCSQSTLYVYGLLTRSNSKDTPVTTMVLTSTGIRDWRTREG